MAWCVPNHRRLLVNAMLIALMLGIFALPATQSALAGALEEATEMTEKVLHFPCDLLNHDKCFTLDRLDPTCPQCF